MQGGGVELTDGDFLWPGSVPTEDGDAGDDDGFLIPAGPDWRKYNG